MRNVCLWAFCFFFFFSGNAVLAQVYLINENFNAAGTPAGWIKINNSPGVNVAVADWTLRPNGYIYSSFFVKPPETFYSNDNSQFYLTNSDTLGDLTETILQTPAFSTVGHSTITLKFYHYFWEYVNDTGFVDISKNATDWTTIASYTLPANSRQGTSTSFVQKTVDLSAFAGNPIVYVRFRYYAENGFYWALDNVSVTGLTLSCSVNNWNGTVSTAWENPANWSCGNVPDANSVVFINSGKQNYPVVNSMATCKSITAVSGTSLRVAAGFKLDITGL